MAVRKKIDFTARILNNVGSSQRANCGKVATLLVFFFLLFLVSFELKSKVILIKWL